MKDHDSKQAIKRQINANVDCFVYCYGEVWNGITTQILVQFEGGKASQAEFRPQ